MEANGKEISIIKETFIQVKMKRTEIKQPSRVGKKKRKNTNPLKNEKCMKKKTGKHKEERKPGTKGNKEEKNKEKTQ